MSIRPRGWQIVGRQWFMQKKTSTLKFAFVLKEAESQRLKGGCRPCRPVGEKEPMLSWLVTSSHENLGCLMIEEGLPLSQQKNFNNSSFHRSQLQILVTTWCHVRHHLLVSLKNGALWVSFGTSRRTVPERVPPRPFGRDLKLHVKGRKDTDCIRIGFI